ncbi:MAG: D-2-hydroxyacid dehydrogenase [Spirochaetaceae bacterium]|nr:D-2-hydroxyacid dehydrogenase [Spirochaetaceae bacterium]
MKILVCFPFSDAERGTLDAVARRHGGHEVVHVDSPRDALAVAGDAEVVMGNLTPALMLAAREAKWAHSYSAGLDKVLNEQVAALPVTLTNMAGKYAVQGGEHAWALLLALSRGVGHAAAVKRWQHATVFSLTGGTLLIIGLGGFGIETLKRAAGYDMTVLALDPVRTEAPDGVAEVLPPTRDNLHAFLARADAVAVTCPLTAQTYHMIGAAELAAMKPTAYLVNVSRGGIIDEPALMAALRDGRIAAAGLDVTEVEPVPDDSPLWSTPNLVVTPHRAGTSQRRRAETLQFAAEQLERYLTGQPLANVTDMKAGF